MTIREKVVAYREALKFGGATEFRLALNTDTAITLASELAPNELTAPEKVKAAVASWDKLLETKLPDDFDGRKAYIVAQDTTANDFWDGFTAQVVDGVEIHRSR
jgi:hypothetical protein